MAKKFKLAKGMLDAHSDSGSARQISTFMANFEECPKPVNWSDWMSSRIRCP